MKKTLLIFIFANALSFSQGNIYPTETNYGGCIGFSSMYMVLDSIPGQSILNSLGFDTDELGTKPLVFLVEKALHKCRVLGGLVVMRE